MKNDIIEALWGNGPTDVREANEIMDEANVSAHDVAKYIRDTFADQEPETEHVDLVAMTYQFILSKVYNELEDKSVMNTLKPENIVDVDGNYAETTYRAKSPDEIWNITDNIPENIQSEALKWFRNQSIETCCTED